MLNMVNNMNYMIVLAAIASSGLLFLILNGIINTANFKKRALINFIFGGVLTTLYTVVFILDKQTTTIYTDLEYLSFILSSLLYTLIISISQYIKGVNKRQRFTDKYKTVLDKKEYLYLLYRFENNVYLEKENHSGIVIKLGKRDFHDEKIIGESRKYSLIINEDDFEKIGEYIVKNKKGKDDVYHCYLVTLKEELKSMEYIPFDKKEIVNLDFSSIDRQIIFRILLQEKFKVEKEN